MRKDNNIWYIAEFCFGCTTDSLKRPLENVQFYAKPSKAKILTIPMKKP